jgi:hypothetical protein
VCGVGGGHARAHRSADDYQDKISSCSNIERDKYIHVII